MPRSRDLVLSGIIAYFVLNLFQASVLVYYMAEHLHLLWILVIIGYLVSLGYLLKYRCFFTTETRVKAVRKVWIVWLLYIVSFDVSIIAIFSSVVNELDTKFERNALKSVLCITPVLLILLLNTTIPPGNQRFVERLSMIAVLDLFDGIEMLEIILLQENSFDLPETLERCIIGFVCISFFLSPFALCQHKVDARTGEMKMRKRMLLVRTSIQVLFVNLAFLVVRCIVWSNYHYDASIFITKNILSILINGIEIFAVFGCCECGNETNETFYVWIFHY